MNNLFTQNQQTRLNQLEQFSQLKYPYGSYQQNNNNVLYALINGFEEAKTFPIMSGKVGLLFDNTQNEFYLKNVDQIGMQTIKKFTYTEVELPSISTPAIANNQDKTEMENLNKRMENLEMILQKLTTIEKKEEGKK